MKGGGEFEAFCPACGLPFGDGYGSRHEYPWLISAFGYERGTNRIIELEMYDYMGGFLTCGIDFPEEEAVYNPDMKLNFLLQQYTPTGADDDDAYVGLAIHRDCVDLIERELRRKMARNTKLTYDDLRIMENTLTHEDLAPYNDGQFFQWSSAKERLPAWIFASPMHNENALKRIMTNLYKNLWGHFFQDRISNMDIVWDMDQLQEEGMNVTLRDILTSSRRLAHINEVDDTGRTMLHHAVMFNKPGVVIELLELGADPKIPSDRGDNILELLQQRNVVVNGKPNFANYNDATTEIRGLLTEALAKKGGRRRKTRRIRRTRKKQTRSRR